MSYENEKPVLAWDDKYFDELEAIQMDPFISTVFTKVRLYNELLNHQAVDDESIIEIVNELDGEWNFLLGEVASATGNIEFPDEKAEAEDCRPLKSYYENQEVKFYGITARKLEEECHANRAIDEKSDEQTDSKYELRVQFTREGLDSNGELLLLTGSATVDDIVGLEFCDRMSPERARSWLNHFHPDLIDDIDECLLNPSSEECEIVMRLDNLEVDLGKIFEFDADMAELSKAALAVYVGSLFNFDDSSPYTVTAAGDVWTFTDYGAVESASAEVESLAKVTRIVWQPAPGDNDTTARPLLDVWFLPTDKDEEELHLLVPLRSIETFRSVRHAYFVGYDD